MEYSWLFQSIDWLIGWLTDWLTDWLVGWLVLTLQSKKGRRNKHDDSDEEEAAVEKKEQPALDNTETLSVKETKGKKGVRGKAAKVCQNVVALGCWNIDVFRGFFLWLAVVGITRWWERGGTGCFVCRCCCSKGSLFSICVHCPFQYYSIVSSRSTRVFQRHDKNFNRTNNFKRPTR